MAEAPNWGFDLDERTGSIATVGLGLERSPVLADGPLSVQAWDALQADAKHHRLHGLLVAAVSKGELASTEAQRGAVASAEMELTLARIWHEARADEVGHLLESVGIETRVLKGPALASLDYPDPQWRPTQDLDLLVRGSDIERASRLLVDHGGRRTDPDPTPGYAATVGKGATIAMPDGLEVDLHRLLIWGPLGVRLPTDELWHISRPFRWGDRAFETLGVEETLLHACSHLLVLGWRRALTLRDVVQVALSPTLDVERLLWLARRWGLETVLATGLLLAVRELDLLKTESASVDRTMNDLFGDRAIVMEWAAGFEPRWRDLLWLRVERPGDPIGSLEAFATYLELRGPDARRTMRAATFRPAPGTYPSPAARARRVARRSVNKVTRPTGFLEMNLPRRGRDILGGSHATH